MRWNENDLFKVCVRWPGSNSAWEPWTKFLSYGQAIESHLRFSGQKERVLLVLG